MINSKHCIFRFLKSLSDWNYHYLIFVLGSENIKKCCPLGSISQYNCFLKLCFFTRIDYCKEISDRYSVSVHKVYCQFSFNIVAPDKLIFGALLRIYQLLCCNVNQFRIKYGHKAVQISSKLIFSITSLIILTNIGAVNFVERTCTRPMQNPLANSKKA